MADWEESSTMVAGACNMDTDQANSSKRNNEEANESQPRRRRNNNANDDQVDNQQSGGFERRRRDGKRDYNNREDNGDQNNFRGNRRFNNNQDGNDQQDSNNANDQNNGERRRRGGYFQNNNNDNNADFGGRRRSNNNNDSEPMDTNEQDGGRRRRRGDNNQQNGDNQDNNQESGRRRRRGDDQGDSNNNNAGGDNESGVEKKKENYIPRRYKKEDEDLFDHVGEGINFAKFNDIPIQVSGENIPQPIEKFSDVAKDPSIAEAIKKSGYTTLTPIQKYGISIVMNGRDLMGSATTGSGKTIAFLLPIIQNLIQNESSKDYGDKCSPQALIITPTRELAIQIYEQAMKLCFKNDLRPCVIYGGAAFQDQSNRISYGANIIVATCGRLIHFLEKEFIKFDKLKYLVLDEADRMIDQGFIPEIRRIINEFDMPADRHTMMFSATFPNDVQRLAQEFLKQDYIFLSVGILGAANSDVKQEIRQVEFKQKKNELLKILSQVYNKDERILVFCQKKKTADFLAGNLCDHDYKTTSIHGDRLQSQREQALNTFKKGETPVLVATSVAARGLDIKGVTYVINYDLPPEIEEYVHRIGRTGRVGNCGTSISFYNDNDDAAIAPKLVELLKEAGEPVPDFLAEYDSGRTFGNETAEKDARADNVDNGTNFTQRTDNYPAKAVAADDDW